MLTKLVQSVLSVRSCTHAGQQQRSCTWCCHAACAGHASRCAKAQQHATGLCNQQHARISAIADVLAVVLDMTQNPGRSTNPNPSHNFVAELFKKALHDGVAVIDVQPRLHTHWAGLCTHLSHLIEASEILMERLGKMSRKCPTCPLSCHTKWDLWPTFYIGHNHTLP